MKFGGASVKNAEAVKNVASILREFVSKTPLLVVISAMDKTTNHLEQLAWAARDSKENETWARFEKIRSFHLEIVDALFGGAAALVHADLEVYFNEIERVIKGILLLAEFPPRTYDRIVAYGELISSAILTHYLRHVGLVVACPDARELIRTDARYTQAQVIWPITRDNIQQKVLPLLQTHQVVVTQGFIASSMEGKVTTLGREGSDYTGSIFASCLEAQSFTVWKDVRGVLNGDPRVEPVTVKLDELSYERAVEMTFYGATVIHPKTIRPLRNAGIPLYVKCFLDLNESGTVIASGEKVKEDDQISIRTWKRGQAVLSSSARDFSFMDEQHLGRIFQLVTRSGLAVNLVQVTAIGLELCVTWNEAAVREFESLMVEDYVVVSETGYALRTVINHDAQAWTEVKGARILQVVGNKLLGVLKD